MKLAPSAASGAALPLFSRPRTAKFTPIKEQDKVKDSAGKKVTITGKMDGETISVETIKAM